VIATLELKKSTQVQTAFFKGKKLNKYRDYLIPSPTEWPWHLLTLVGLFPRREIHRVNIDHHQAIGFNVIF